MNIDEGMEKLFKHYAISQRQMVEADPFYQAAKKSGDLPKAAALACEILEGSVKTPAQGRKMRNKKKKAAELQKQVAEILNDLGLYD